MQALQQPFKYFRKGFFPPTNRLAGKMWMKKENGCYVAWCVQSQVGTHTGHIRQQNLGETWLWRWSLRTEGYKVKVIPGQKQYRSLLKSFLEDSGGFLIVCCYRPWQESKHHWDLVNRPSCKLVARRSSQVSGKALLICCYKMLLSMTPDRPNSFSTLGDMYFWAVKIYDMFGAREDVSRMYSLVTQYKAFLWNRQSATFFASI